MNLKYFNVLRENEDLSYGGFGTLKLIEDDHTRLTTALAAEKEKREDAELHAEAQQRVRNDYAEQIVALEEKVEGLEAARSILITERDGVMSACAGLRTKRDGIEAKVAEQAAEILDREAQHKSTSEIAGAALNKVARLYSLLCEAVKELEGANLMDTPLGEDLKQAIADCEEK